jgi:hypothetical protein
MGLQVSLVRSVPSRGCELECQSEHLGTRDTEASISPRDF